MLWAMLLAVASVGDAWGQGFHLELPKKETRTVPENTKASAVPYQQLGQVKNGTIVVTRDVDLKGKVCRLPARMPLIFKGGIIRNGTLVGNNTPVTAAGKAFGRVTIQGSWNVPNISTAMFADLTYDNALKNVMALADDAVKNVVTIERGTYRVTARKNGDVCLLVVGNTKLVVNGTIRLTPNGYKNYDILRATGNNVHISGKGAIVGDKHTHTGTEGEWGMGLRFHNASHSSVRNLTIRDCWGDCIYVGGKSRDIVIENCTLDHGRRQGISITSADGVTVKNCTITNVKGTAPEYAIDVEPNGGDVVDNIVMEKVVAKNCQGGFLVYGKAKNARVGRVAMRNCTVEYNRKMAVKIVKCDAFKMEKCHVRLKSAQRAMDFADIGDVTVVNNTCHYDDKKASTVNPITVNRCGKRRVENNREN